MKKNSARWWVVLAVALVVYNVIAFAVPFPKNAVFFVSWVFTLLALGAQVYVVCTAFYQGEGSRSKFYGFPIAKIGAVYLAVQMMLGLVFMTLGFALTVPMWMPLVLYVVLLGAAAVGLISTEATRDEIVRQEGNLKKNVFCMRALQSKVAGMVPLTKDTSVRTALEKFAEEIRFSDPISGVTLRDVETDLTTCVDDLQRAVADGDSAAALSMVEKAEATLSERNRLCKLNKNPSA